MIWVDQGYSGEKFPQVVLQVCGARVEISSKPKHDFRCCRNGRLPSVRLDGLAGFIAQATGYELLPDVSESPIKAAMVRLMVKDLVT
ncbi:hypothetical protein [Chroococcidiopsis sp. CCMEE 29]|uniref:hypothetical protein n=1 Tax=Chroococcidiopsis sp. CCMEE 29 TaxID=155894 RepID=UPI00202054BD|nr:hypothetical protein [Chroococcidiopsis sp. CCMEE 29]